MADYTNFSADQIDILAQDVEAELRQMDRYLSAIRKDIPEIVQMAGEDLTFQAQSAFKELMAARRDYDVLLMHLQDAAVKYRACTAKVSDMVEAVYDR